MQVGTKSVLFGAHCFFLHPWFVAWAWWRLYGFPFDPRLWVAFFVHDLGYWGRPNMDGEEGERHIFLGARIMGWLFDKPLGGKGYLKQVSRNKTRDWPDDPHGTWYCFAFYHSRFMAKRYGHRYSKLCVADKLAIVLTPSWLYLPCVCMTGEIHEYREAAAMKDGVVSGYATSHLQWHRAMKRLMRDWVAVHKDGRSDEMTKDRTIVDETGCYA